MGFVSFLSAKPNSFKRESCLQLWNASTVFNLIFVLTVLSHLHNSNNYLLGIFSIVPLTLGNSQPCPPPTPTHPPTHPPSPRFESYSPYASNNHEIFKTLQVPPYQRLPDNLSFVCSFLFVFFPHLPTFWQSNVFVLLPVTSPRHNETSETFV